jgi:uncharacterized membrane protein
MRKLTYVAAAAALSLFAVPANAHHGWGGNVQQVSEMTGMVVESVKLAGPHATMRIESGGKTWDLTLAPPARTAASGLKPNLIPVGAMVTVIGNKSSNPQRFEMKTVEVRWDNKRYTVYPERQAYLPRR